MRDFDTFDARILVAVQRDAGRSIDEIAEEIGLSRNATWRRMRNLEDKGLIAGRVALVDPRKVGLALLVFISVKTDHHDPAWAARFQKAVRDIPEILGAYRTAGDQDYLIQARVRDVPDYDRLYQQLTARVDLRDVTAHFVMEELKNTTVLPIS